MSMVVRSPLKWVGGKAESASRILAAFPPAGSYSTYVEPCGGAAHVLALKPCWGHHEVYNDLNEDLVNFWLHCRDQRDVLAQQLQTLPYARSLYYEYYYSLFDGTMLEPLERAVRWFYVLRGTCTGWLRPSPGGWNNGITGSARAYRNLVEEAFEAISRRMARVVIDNREVERVLETYDSPQTLWYIDPPYIGAEMYYTTTRKNQKQARVFQHGQLAALLQQVKGFVALSYYPHTDLDHWYPRDRWRRLHWRVAKHSHMRAELGRQHEATEMLLMNYAVPTASLWPDPFEEEEPLSWEDETMRAQGREGQ